MTHTHTGLPTGPKRKLIYTARATNTGMDDTIRRDEKLLTMWRERAVARGDYRHVEFEREITVARFGAEVDSIYIVWYALVEK